MTKSLAPAQISLPYKKVHPTAICLPYRRFKTRSTKQIDSDGPSFVPGERQLDVITTCRAGEMSPLQISVAYLEE